MKYIICIHNKYVIYKIDTCIVNKQYYVVSPSSYSMLIKSLMQKYRPTGYLYPRKLGLSTQILDRMTFLLNFFSLFLAELFITQNFSRLFVFSILEILFPQSKISFQAPWAEHTCFT